jgi:hypothetical protein
MNSATFVESILVGPWATSITLGIALFIVFLLVAEVCGRRRANRQRGLAPLTDRLLEKLNETAMRFGEKSGGQPVLWEIAALVREYISRTAAFEFGRVLEADAQELLAAEDPQLLAVLKEIVALEALSVARHAPTLHDGEVAIGRLEAALDSYIHRIDPQAKRSFAIHAATAT